MAHKTHGPFTFPPIPPRPGAPVGSHFMSSSFSSLPGACCLRNAPTPLPPPQSCSEWLCAHGPTLPNPRALDHQTLPEWTTFPQLLRITCQPACPSFCRDGPSLLGSSSKGCEIQSWGHRHICLGVPRAVPLVVMSLLTMVGGVTNQAVDMSVKITISGYEVAAVGEGREALALGGSFASHSSPI